MASRFWVGGTGTWDGTTTTNWSATSGGAGGASVPTTTDDVFFDGNSGTGTVSVNTASTANCFSFSSVGYTGTLALAAQIVPSGTSVTLGTGTTFTGANGFNIFSSGTLTFTSNGKTIGSLSVSNSASVLSLADALSVTNAISHNIGTFTTNNFAVTCGVFTSNNSNTRTLTLGSSSVTITGTGVVWNTATATGLTVTANTANVTMSGTGAVFSSTTVNWNGMSVAFTGSGLTQSSASTFANFTRTGTASKFDSHQFTSATATTVTGTFTATGNSATNRLLVQSNTVGSGRTITAAAVSVSNADFMDIAITQWATGGTVGNLLTANQSNIETNTTGLQGTNTTITRVTTQASEGAASLQVAADGVNAAVAGTTAGLSGIAATAGTTYYGTVDVKRDTANASAAQVSCSVLFYDSSGAQIGNSPGTAATLSTTAFTTLVASGVAPAGTAFAAVIFTTRFGVVPAAGALYYADKFGLSSTVQYATTVTGTSLGDALGNSGITFTTATTRYYVGATSKSWSDPTAWSATSGGASGASVPLPQDDVICNAASPNNTLTYDMPRSGKNFTCTGWTGNLTGGIATSFFGSATLAAGVTVNLAAFSWTLSGRGSHTLTSAGKALNATLFVTAPGGVYTLADALNDTFGGVTHNNGTLDTASFAVAAPTFTSTSGLTRALTLGTSTVSLTATSGNVWTVASTGLTMSAASSTIVVSVASTGVRSLAFGAGLVYGTVTYTVAASTGGLQFSNNPTITTLNVSGGTRYINFQSTVTFTVTNWNVFGTVGAVVSIFASTPGSAAIISKASGYIASDYVSVQDITGTGGATYYMGSRSTNVSGNTGLSFTDAPQRYWVGGTATWDGTTTTNWALFSGSTGGLAVPTLNDDVYFDANSGTGSVTLGALGNTRNLVFTGYTGTFVGNSQSVLVNGPICTFVPGMTLSGSLGFATNGFTITTTLTSAGKTFAVFTVQNTSTVSLADALSVTGALTVTQGTFTTNNFSVTALTIASSNSSARTISLGSSSVTLTGANTIDFGTSTSLSVTVNTAFILATGSGPTINMGNVNMNGASFTATGAGTLLVTSFNAPTTWVNFTRTGTALKTDAVTFGQSVAGTTTLAVTGTLTLNGNSAINRLLVQSSIIGTNRTVNAAAVVLSNVDFMDTTLVNSGTPTWTTGGVGANTLTANQSSAETDLTGFVANAALVRSTADARSGVASLLYTAPSSGAAQGLSTNNVPVLAGATYTFLGSGKAGPTITSVAPSIGLKIRWKDAGGTQIGSSVGGGTVTPTAAWADVPATTATAPAGAAFVSLEVLWQSVVNAGDQFYADQLAIMTLNSGTSLGDAGGNTGITFTPAVQQFWRNNGGNWSDATHWSLTSGGGATGRVPLPQDNVRFDVNSFSLTAQTVTGDMPRTGATDWTGVTNSPTYNPGTTVVVFGSLTLISAMTYAATAFNTGFAGRGVHTITSAGKQFPNTVTFQGASGSYTLQDAFSTAGAFSVSNGTVNTNNVNVTCVTFATTSGATRSLTLGTSTVSLTSASASTVWNAAPTALTFSAASSTIVITSASSAIRNFITGGLAYGTINHTVAASTGRFNISPNGATIGTLNVTSTSGSKLLTFGAGQTYSIANWNVWGTVGNVVSVTSDTAGTAATISKASGYIASDYVSVQDITGAATGATYYMGSRSTNVSGNTGLSFTDAPQRYWVGGTANWDATAGTKWAVVSGGTGGIAVPTSTEDAYFDANSGAGTVTLTASGGVKNLDFTGFTGTWTQVSSGFGLTISGAVFRLASTMSITGGLLNLTVQPGTGVTMLLTSAGKVIPLLGFGGVGTVQMQDALSIAGTLLFSNGSLVTNNFAVTCGSFSSSNGNTRTLTLGSSSVTVTASGTSWTTAANSGLTVTANTAVVTMTNAGTSTAFSSATQNWNGASLVALTAGTFTLSGGQTFANATRTGTALKTDSLILNGNLTVTGTFTVNGNSATNRMLVQSNTVGTARTITAATVTGSNVDFMDITGAGAGSWNLSAITGGSGDAGGNSGITFTTGTTRYGVAAGNWSSTAMWSTTSGGAGGASVPLPQDDVILDANSAAGTYVTDMPRAGRNFTATAFTRTLNINANAGFFGSITFGSGMPSLLVTTGLWAQGRGTHTFTSAGVIQTAIFFSAPGGTYTLADAFTSSQSSGIQHLAGTLSTNGMSVIVPAMASASGQTRALTLGTSTVALNSTAGSSTLWNVSPTGLTLSASSSVIAVVAATSNNGRIFAGGGFTYGTLTYTVVASSGSLVITGANTFTTLNVGSGRTLTLPSSATTTVANWNVAGQDFDYMYFNGLASSYVSTPDSAALSVTGDIDLRARVALDDWTPVNTNTIIAKRGGASSDISYELRIGGGGSSGVVQMVYSLNGTTALLTISTAIPVVSDGSPLWIRATRVSATGTITFYTSPDGSTWTQLGSTVAGTSGAMFDSVAPVELGVYAVTNEPLAGKFYRAQILNGIGGTAVLDVDFAAMP